MKTDFLTAMKMCRDEGKRIRFNSDFIFTDWQFWCGALSSGMKENPSCIFEQWEIETPPKKMVTMYKWACLTSLGRWEETSGFYQDAETVEKTIGYGRNKTKRLDYTATEFEVNGEN